MQVCLCSYPRAVNCSWKTGYYLLHCQLLLRCSYRCVLHAAAVWESCSHLSDVSSDLSGTQSLYHSPTASLVISLWEWKSGLSWVPFWLCSGTFYTSVCCTSLICKIYLTFSCECWTFCLIYLTYLFYLKNNNTKSDKLSDFYVSVYSRVKEPTIFWLWSLCEVLIRYNGECNKKLRGGWQYVETKIIAAYVLIDSYFVLSVCNS